ncbi:MAG: methanol/ethanol family PQQ-dependent dehydrogenase, partial [Gammaproteobacteria bacterium]|nr:methanol/ethanol family PQQ-dependent dehydrogenase [Gammaproteobacteria bacterium]
MPKGRSSLFNNKRIVWSATLMLLLSPMLAAGAPIAGNVDAARLQAADAEPQNWFTGGRDKDGTYYSPLTSINAQNVNRLGFAWTYDLGNPQRGQEATPLVIDGVMYTS